MSARTIVVGLGLLLGTAIGGIGQAVMNSTVRTCEEVEEGVMVCDDDTTCLLVNGIWMCENDQRSAPAT